MKLTQFTPEVNRNITQARVQAVSNPAAFGGDVSGSTLMGKAIGAGMTAYANAWQKDQNDRVIDATNDYNQQINSLLYDEKNGIFNQYQGKSAEMAQEAYQDQEQRIRAGIMQKYKLDGNYAQRAFQEQINPGITSTLSAIDKYQRKEAESYANDQLTLLLENTSNGIVQDPKNTTPLLGTLGRAYAATATALGISPEAQKVQMRKNINAIASGVLKTMADTGDYENGTNTVSIFRAQGVDETVLKPYEKAFLQKRETQKATDVVRQAFQNDPGMYHMTPEEAAEKIIQNNPFQGTREGISSGNSDWDKYDDIYQDIQKQYGWDDKTIRTFKAMGLQESSMDPNAVSSDGNDGEGIYQFDAPTAESVGLNPSERMDPEKNIRAAAVLFQRRLEKYGGDIEKAELAHNGGEGGLEAARANGYLEDVQSKYDALYGTPASPEELAAQQEAYKASIMNEIIELKKQRQDQVRNTMNDITIELSKMGEAGNTSAAQLTYLESQLTAHPELEDSAQYWVLRNSLADKRRAEISGRSRGTGGAGKMGSSQVLRWKSFIASGDIRTQAELDDKVRNSGVIMSDTEYNTLTKYLHDKQQGTGDFAVDINTSKSEVEQYMGWDKDTISDTDFNRAKVLSRQWAVSFHDENGRWPTELEIMGNLGSQLAYTVAAGTDDVSRVDLGKAGIQRIYNTDDPDYQTVIFKDGRQADVYRGDVDGLLNGTLTENDIAFTQEGGMM